MAGDGAGMTRKGARVTEGERGGVSARGCSGVGSGNGEIPAASAGMTERRGRGYDGLWGAQVGRKGKGGCDGVRGARVERSEDVSCDGGVLGEAEGGLQWGGIGVGADD